MIPTALFMFRNIFLHFWQILKFLFSESSFSTEKIAASADLLPHPMQFSFPSTTMQDAIESALIGNFSPPMTIFVGDLLISCFLCPARKIFCKIPGMASVFLRALLSSAYSIQDCFFCIPGIYRVARLCIAGVKLVALIFDGLLVLVVVFVFFVS
jgi:hypothetical protein